MGVKEGYPLSGYFTDVGSSRVKTVEDKQGHTAYQALVTSL